MLVTFTGTARRLWLVLRLVLVERGDTPRIELRQHSVWLNGVRVLMSRIQQRLFRSVD